MNRSPSSILIVDDNLQNLQFLGKLLEEHGYEPTAVTNGFQALDFSGEKYPELILLDVMMPELDGFQTCRKLKESSRTRDIPIIFLTAKVEPEDIVKGFQLGAVDYVTKPFNSVELLARVQTQLELNAGRQMITKQNNEFRELLHILCHDVKNPLSAVTSIVELLRIDAVSLADALNFLEVSSQNGHDIIDLVRQIMVLETKETTLQLEELCLDDLIAESTTMLHPKISEKGIALELKIDSELTIKVNKTAFVNSVLNNLITNAVKFSHVGEKIEIKGEKHGDSVVVSIRDYGIGMPQELLADLFKIEKNTTRAGTKAEKGTGFGMPLVQKFMHAFGGKIEVLTEEKTTDSKKHGTEIKLELRSY